jgi:hypothetical protein
MILQENARDTLFELGVLAYFRRKGLIATLGRQTDLPWRIDCSPGALADQVPGELPVGAARPPTADHQDIAVQNSVWMRLMTATAVSVSARLRFMTS